MGIMFELGRSEQLVMLKEGSQLERRRMQVSCFNNVIDTQGLIPIENEWYDFVSTQQRALVRRGSTQRGSSTLRSDYDHEWH